MVKNIIDQLELGALITFKKWQGYGFVLTKHAINGEVRAKVITNYDEFCNGLAPKVGVVLIYESEIEAVIVNATDADEFLEAIGEKI